MKERVRMIFWPSFIVYRDHTPPSLASIALASALHIFEGPEATWGFQSKDVGSHDVYTNFVKRFDSVN